MAGELFGWDNAKAVAQAAPVLIKALDRVVERNAVEAGENSKPFCPFKFGTLQKSLSAQEKWTSGLKYNGKTVEPVTGKKKVKGVELKPMERLVGSSLPYAKVQEHHHKTKSFFLKKGLASVKKQMKDMARETVIQILGQEWTKGGGGIG